MFNEKQQYAIQEMATAFKSLLIERIGTIEQKPPIELAAWSQALTELGQETSLALLNKTEQTKP